jgi:cytochrome c peroxidase
LCVRNGTVGEPSQCGKFKVPTLRNVALTAPYFHNGRFGTLREVVDFYATRDTHPERWYPRDAAGNVVKFDDLPPAYRGNVNTSEAPYNRQPGAAPVLNDDEIDMIVEFLNTLTDGYQPNP